MERKALYPILALPAWVMLLLRHVPVQRPDKGSFFVGCPFGVIAARTRERERARSYQGGVPGDLIPLQFVLPGAASPEHIPEFAY